METFFWNVVQRFQYFNYSRLVNNFSINNNNNTLKYKIKVLYIYSSRDIKIIFFFKKIESKSLNFTSNRTRNMNAEFSQTNDNFKKFITIIAIGCRSSPVIYFENKKEI